jgi:hypothetical protein
MAARAALLAWLGVSLVAAFGMYRLWITREYRLYAGKSVSDQRTAVFKHVGFKTYLLRDADTVATSLPPDTDYRPIGDFNRLSYVKYLLIPRIPMPNAAVSLRDTGDSLVLAPLNRQE